MPQYLLSVHHGETGPYLTDEERDQAWADTGAVNDEMRDAGVWRFAGGLQPASTARVVRNEGGAVLRTDGPYLEGKEHIGGFWILDVEDDAAALAWAEKASAACRGAVEVRPFN